MVQLGRVIWPGPVGIGAGIIKGAAVFIDYGQRADSVEVGSITREVCHGNEGQTIWRYPDRQALRHNAGMPNPGAVEIVTQLGAVQDQIKVPWGLNVAVTPGIADANLAAEDIKETVRVLMDGGLKPAWLTFNISSPDTIDKTSQLMRPQRVNACLQALVVQAISRGIPIWLKLGPGLDAGTMGELLKVAVYAGVETIQVSNAMPDPNGQKGGWCGAAIKPTTLALVGQIRQMLPTMPIVSLGGILKGQDLAAAIQAGAQAVQVVSATLIRGRDAATIIRQEWEQGVK